MDSSDTDQIATIKNWLKTGSINIFGMPFAGKDTVAKALAAHLDGVVIGGGEIIRTAEGIKEVQEHVDKGNLAPTDEYLKIVLPYLSQASFKNKALILSALGRWHGEETGVMQAAEESGHPLLAVVNIRISEAEMRKRRQSAAKLEDRGQRVDDSEQAIELRLTEFRNKTLPVLDFYKEKGLLIEVNGEASRPEVLAEIIEKLASRASAKP